MNSSIYRAPRCIRLLAQHGASALRPKFENGRFTAPMVSRRVAAQVRKRAIIEGTWGSFSPIHGGWDPLWDTPNKIAIIKPNRGHKNERTRPERAEKITKAMQGMADRVEKYKKEVEERKPKKDIAFMFKRVADLTATRRSK